MHYLQALNTVQRNAVTTTEGPVLVIAGPGSGKTRVLTFRIAYLLEKGVPPHQILALTFTNKAAKEMKDRIEQVVGPKAQAVWAGTFHSIFARILRAEAPKIGFPSTFSIYDTDDSNSLLRAILKEMQLDPQVYNIGMVRSRISLAKSNLLTPQAYRDHPEMREQDRMARRPFLADIYERYMERCRRAGAMDFDDLLLQLYRLFRDNPEGVVEKYRRKFRYLHVDEFQDTNFLQYAILRRLVKYEGSPENIFIVGDDAQSIYAFRGATIDNILDFEKDYPNLQTFKLEQNYRSTHHIIQAANEIISHNRRQLPKTIWTDKEDRAKIKVLKCATDDEEARRVADLILEQKNRFHIPNAEIAILYRTNAQSRKFEEQLRRYNLPYRIFGGMSFYQRKEVKDFVAYLRLAVNPMDEEAFRRIVNYPTRGIGESSIDKITRLAAERDVPLWDAMLYAELSDRARKALGNFRQLVESWQKRALTDNAAKLAADIMRQSTLYDTLRADTSPEGISRLENVNAVLDAVAEFVDNQTEENEDAPNTTLATYLQTISLLTDADEQTNDRDYITLMSTHAAKGLEFKSVFVTGLEETLFPSFMAMEEANGLDEERRLFYVAVTRAKQLLTLTYAQNRYRYGQIRSNSPSRFFEEISPENFELQGGLGAARPQPPQSNAPARSGVTGKFAPPKMRAHGPIVTAAVPDDFTAAAPDAIKTGVRVRHLKFGEGTVVSVEGAKDNKVAGIRFVNDDQPERRIVLKFAKLQVLE